MGTADGLRHAIKAMSEAAFPERFGTEQAYREGLTVVRCVSRPGRGAARMRRWRTNEPEATLPERTHAGVSGLESTICRGGDADRRDPAPPSRLSGGRPGGISGLRPPPNLR